MKSWTHLEDLQLVQMGIYEVLSDGVQKCSMLVREWEVRTWFGFRKGFKKRGRLASYCYTADDVGDFVPRPMASANPVRDVVVWARGG
jgi:hypothetical protein